MYSWSICDPLNPKVVDMGSINKGDIYETFVSYPWTKKLEEIKKRPKKVYYSPTIEFKHIKSSVSFSVVQSKQNFKFIFFYKRKKLVKSFLGFKEKNILTDIEISFDDAKTILKKYLDNDQELIEEYIDSEIYVSNKKNTRADDFGAFDHNNKYSQWRHCPKCLQYKFTYIDTIKFAPISFEHLKYKDCPNCAVVCCSNILSDTLYLTILLLSFWTLGGLSKANQYFYQHMNVAAGLIFVINHFVFWPMIMRVKIAKPIEYYLPKSGLTGWLCYLGIPVLIIIGLFMLAVTLDL